MAIVSKRAWCAELQYEGCEPFFYGTVWVDNNATFHEIELAVQNQHATHMPANLAWPKLLDLVPGMLVFHPEE